MTIDNETAQRIRSLLNPKGYKVGQTKGLIGGVDYLGDYTFIAPNGFFMAKSSNEADCWLAALEYDLNDKAQTGARIADICKESSGGIEVAEYHIEDPRWDAACEGHEELGFDPDDAIAALWLKVHNLPDPRQKVTV